MSDEIKAFLVNIKENEEYKAIYDYITNLQQENERLKERLNRYNKYTCLRSKIMLDDYKSRCEKVKEYIEKHVICMKNSNILTELNINDLLNILQGGKDDNKKEGK